MVLPSHRIQLKIFVYEYFPSFQTLQFFCNSFVMTYVGIKCLTCLNGQTVSAVDSSASWVNVSRCEFKSSYLQFLFTEYYTNIFYSLYKAFQSNYKDN